MKYPRGLTRVSLVLWAIWVLIVLFVFPWYEVINARDKAADAHLQALRARAEQNEQSAASWERLSKSYTQTFNYTNIYRGMLQQWPLTLGALIGAPAVLYGLLCGIVLTFGWVVRGFKRGSPGELPTGGGARSPNTWIKTCAGLALLVIAASVAYYFVIFLPRERTARLEMDRQKVEVERQQKLAADQIEREKLEQQRQEKLTSELRETRMRDLLAACLAGTYAIYSERWQRTCRARGLAENCQLPLDVAESYEKDHYNERADCFKSFPQR